VPKKINPLGHWGILLKHTRTLQKIKEVPNLYRPAGGYSHDELRLLLFGSKRVYKKMK
jgi:hypothetical protein